MFDIQNFCRINQQWINKTLRETGIKDYKILNASFKIRYGKWKVSIIDSLYNKTLNII